ncbi:MAG TPA: chaperonin GroEL [Flavobacteriales bacterium]|nr:chaperonin GroEL [Flavobacteriales bacterium]
MLKCKFEDRTNLNEKVLNGVNRLADSVASTLGPKGRNVILQEKGKDPFITKDGVTVSAFVHIEDEFENAGAQIIKQATSQTNAVAGDGTTTATVLARAILVKAQRYIAAGASPTELKRGIDAAVESLTAKLLDIAIQIETLEDVENIATISANNDKTIGKLVATAVDKAGKDGSITIEESKTITTTLDLIEGFRVEAGYAASAFVTDDRRATTHYESPLLLVTDTKIENVEQILPVLELVSRDGRPLIIVAEEIEGQALAALIMNTVRGSMKIAAVKAPFYGDRRRNILADLALSTGAEFFSRDSTISLKDIKLENLGQSRSIEITKTNTTVIGGWGNSTEIDSRIELLKSEMIETDDIRECDKLQERITKLASGVAVIRVGAPTAVEMIEKKHRIEDALEAVKSAQEEGIVPGGGVALIRCSTVLSVAQVENEDQQLGVEIIREALTSPLRQMAINCGLSPDLILNMVEAEAGNMGYDFRNDIFTDMLDAGIIDPVKVTRSALQNAASAAGILITTSHAIVEV